MPERNIEEVLADHTDGWMAIPGVVGTGIGSCGRDLCIKVFVSERTPRVEAEIPHVVEGFPVRIEATGDFRAGEASSRDETSPYAGFEDRPIKALEPAEVAAYLGGERMRYALAAKLNHYPGPKHAGHSHR